MEQIEIKAIKVMSVCFPEKKKTFNQWAEKIHRHVKKTRY